MQAIEAHPTIPGASILSIPAFTQELFEAQIVRLNKKLGKNGGLTQFQVIGMEVAQVPSNKLDAFNKPRMLDILKVSCYIPQLPESDWQLISILKDDSHVGGEFICTNLADFDAVGMKITCDHCGHNRFRALGFVLRHNVTKEIKTIGSSCIDTYLNRNVEKAIKTFKNWLDSFLHPIQAACNGDFDGIDKEWGCARFRGTPVDSILLAATFAYSIDSKWTNSKGNFHELLHDILFPSTNNKRKSLLEDCQQKYGSRAETVGAEVFAYIRSKEFHDVIDTSTSWGQNLKACCFHQNGEPKAYTTHPGMIGWAAFQRMANLNRAAQANVAANNKVSNHLGKVGDKIAFVGEVTLVKYCENAWGSSTLINAVDTTGNIVSTFLNGGKGNDLKLGDAINITAKVKAHDDFRGTKRTVLSYVKFA